MGEAKRKAGMRTVRLPDPRRGTAAAEGACASAREAAAAGDVIVAATLFEAAIASDPDHAAARLGLAELLAHQGLAAEAAVHAERAAALDPRSVSALNLLCVTLMRAGRAREAVAYGRRAATLAPDDLAVTLNLAAALDESGSLGEAIGLYGEVLRARPEAAPVAEALADAFRRCGRLDEALEAVRRSIASDPARPEAHCTLGNVHRQRGELGEALKAYVAAVQLKGDYAPAHSNLAVVLRQAGHFQPAVASGSIAVRLMPDAVEPHINYASALQAVGRFGEAIGVLRRAVGLRSDLGMLRVELCAMRRHVCDWHGLAEAQREAAAASFGAGQRVFPFPVVTSEPSPERQLACARVWAAGLSARPVERAGAPEGRKLRVGYLSADFYEHATALLVAGLLEHQDRSEFELFGYSIGHNDGGALRARLEASFDHFLDLRDRSDHDAAVRIAADRLDILIDLKGYTEGARTEILAGRPAPVQVNFLGYPGSMGAPFIDYIIADAVVAPFEHAAHFDEKIVHLPHCYQPNDRRRAAGRPDLDRTAVGLPREAFVFCSFNNTYKLTAEVFAIWMRLLAAVPGSVLWQLEANPEVAANLRREALRHGVDPARLVFAPRVGVEEHIGRMALADLFLDTLPVNAHTTASEALWAGLPVLTCLGEAMVSRVAASLLQAVGLPELVTTSLADYEALALALARDVPRLDALRRRLAARRLDAPLFDTAAYARGFEHALRTMARRQRAGAPPQSFAVPPVRGQG